MKVGLEAVEGAETEGALDASLENGVVVSPALASLANAGRGEHLVAGADTLQVVERLHNGDAVASENGENRG